MILPEEGSGKHEKNVDGNDFVRSTFHVVRAGILFQPLYEDNSLVTGRCYRIDPAYAQETTYTVEMLEQMDLDTLHTVFPEEKIRYGFYFGGKKISDRRK